MHRRIIQKHIIISLMTSSYSFLLIFPSWVFVSDSIWLILFVLTLIDTYAARSQTKFPSSVSVLSQILRSLIKSMQIDSLVVWHRDGDGVYWLIRKLYRSFCETRTKRDAEVFVTEIWTHSLTPITDRDRHGWTASRSITDRE